MIQVLSQSAARLPPVISGGGGPFDPLSIAGCKCWLKANAGVYKDSGSTLAANTEAVQQWNDQSGNGNHVTKAGATGPFFSTNVINSLPVVRFASATSDSLTNSTPFGAPYTISVVARLNALGSRANARVISSKINNWLLGWWGNTMDDAYFEGWVNGPTGVVGAPTWKQYTGQSDGTTSSFYSAGSLLASNSAGTAGPFGLSLASWQGNSELSDCDVAEVIIYNTVLNGTNRGNVENYLIAKYGL